MTRFLMTVVDADHVILATESTLNKDEHVRVRAAFDQWKQNGGLLVISDCAVRDRAAVEVELDLGGTTSEAEVRHERLLNRDRNPNHTEDAYEEWARDHGGRRRLHDSFDPRKAKR